MHEVQKVDVFFEFHDIQIKQKETNGDEMQIKESKERRRQDTNPRKREPKRRETRCMYTSITLMQHRLTSRSAAAAVVVVVAAAAAVVVWGQCGV